jgi:ABC-2 type transport system permease protein
MSTAVLPRAMSSEWIKLKSVRSTRWTVALFATMTVGIAALIAVAVSSQWATMNPADKASFNATDASLQGLVLAQLVIGVLGVLAVTAEYSSGTIRATLAAVPRRVQALSAKALVFAALAAVTALVSCFAAFFVSGAMLHSTGVGASLGDSGALRSVLGASFYLVCIGLIALGIGTVVRSTAAAITSMVGIVFVLPLIVQFLPHSWSHSIAPWLPMSMGQSLASVTHDPSTLAPGGSAVMIAVYAAVALAVGGFFLVRRDA